MHRSNDPAKWRLLLAELELDDGFDVNGDLNLLATCYDCNRSKAGDALPNPQATRRLKEARKKAPWVVRLREEEVSQWTCPQN